MKKIFTLLVGITIAAASLAQYQSNDGYNKGKDNVYNDGRFKKDDKRNDSYYSFSARERDMQVAKINRDYDWKIQDLKKKSFMTRFRKDQMIRQLEDQRRYEIKNVYARFNDRNNRYDDHDHGRH